MLCALMVLTAACRGEPPSLTVGEVAFTENELLGLNEARRMELAELTAFGLIVAREELAVTLSPILERRLDDSLLRGAAAQLMVSNAQVDDQQLEAHYLVNPAVELTVRHVLFFSERWRPQTHRDQARLKGEAALVRLQAGDPFAQVAAELSEEPGAEGRQGLLRPGREGSWVSEFWNAALALEVGDISPVIETQYGFHVLHLEGREVVPFAEARPTVVLQVAQLMGSIEVERSAWIAGQAERITIDEQAVAAWTSSPGGDGSVLARWREGAFTAADLLASLRSEGARAWDRAHSGDRQAALDAVGRAARRALSLEEARAMGIIVPDAERDRVTRDWEDQTRRWSVALGFAPGMGPTRVKEAARAALASTQQGATIARQELVDLGPLLRLTYPARETLSPKLP